MKKLIVGKIIEEGKGICDWCGEKKEGYLGKTTKKSVLHLDNDKIGLLWLRGEEWFSEKKLFWATRDKEYKWTEVKFTPLICSDCVKQLK